MFGLFDLFGRRAALRGLDAALRGAGLHPILVPEAVKLTLLRLTEPEGQGGAATRAEAQTAARAEAARLVALLVLGREGAASAAGRAEAEAAEARLHAAIEAGDSRDARIVLLLLHAGLIAPEFAELVEAETEAE